MTGSELILGSLFSHPLSRSHHRSCRMSHRVSRKAFQNAVEGFDRMTCWCHTDRVTAVNTGRSAEHECRAVVEYSNTKKSIRITVVLFKYLKSIEYLILETKTQFAYLFNILGTENLTRVMWFVKENVQFWGSQQNQPATRCQLFSEIDVKIA